MKFKELIKGIETVCLSIPNVNSFYFGDIYSLNHHENVRFSTMVLTEKTHTKNRVDGTITCRFYLFYVDRLTNDKENTIDIFSTGHETLDTVIANLEENGVIVNSYELNDVKERFNDECGVVFADVEVLLQEDCDIPFIIQGNCDEEIKELEEELANSIKDYRFDRTNRPYVDYYGNVFGSDELVLIKNNGEEINTSDFHSSNVPYEGYTIYYTTNNGLTAQTQNNDGLTSLRNMGLISNTYKDGVGKMVFSEPFTEIGKKAFYGCNTITMVEIPSGVTRVGVSAFTRCENLEMVVLPEGLKVIDSDSFANCTSLQSIDFPSTVKTIWSRAFAGCQSLQSVEIPPLVTELHSYTFGGCSALTSVTISENVNSIDEGCFTNCTSLTEIAFPPSQRWFGWSVFSGCTNLNKVTIPVGTKIGDFNPQCFANVPEIGDLYCPKDWYYNLSQANISFMGNVYNWRKHWNDMETTEIPYKTLLNELYPTNDALLSMGLISNDYYGDSGLMIFEGTLNEIADDAFANTSTSYGDGNVRITRIVLPDSIKRIGDRAFRYQASLINNNPSINNDPSRTLFKFPPYLEEIGEYAFSYCEQLRDATLPNTMKTIGEGAFAYANLGEGFVFPSGVTVVSDGVLAGNRYLTGITLSNQTTYIGETAFWNLYYLKSVGYPSPKVHYLYDAEIPETCTYIGGGAFGHCPSLKRIFFPSGVTELNGGMFAYSSGLTYVSMSEDITKFNVYTHFQNCTSLSRVNSDEEGFVKLPLEIGETLPHGCFALCPNIKRVRLPKTITRIDLRAFSGCTSLEEVVIPYGVTYVGNHAFSGCTSLTSVTIPDTLTTYYDGMFEGVPTEGDLYCYKEWYDALKSYQITYLGNVYNWRKHWLDGEEYPEQPTEKEIEEPDPPVDPPSGGDDDDNPSVDDIYKYLPIQNNEIWYQTTDNQAIDLDRYGNPVKTIGGKMIISNTYNDGIGIIELDGDLTYIESLNVLKNRPEYKIQALVLPKSVERIEDNAFKAMPSMELIYMPNTITYIGDEAFSECFGFQSVGNVFEGASMYIPSGVTTLNPYLFTSDRALTSVTIPSTVTEIGSSVFSHCENLKELIIEGNPTINGFTFILMPEQGDLYCQQDWYETNENNLTAFSGWTKHWL